MAKSGRLAVNQHQVNGTVRYSQRLNGIPDSDPAFEGVFKGGKGKLFPEKVIQPGIKPDSHRFL